MVCRPIRPTLRPGVVLQRPAQPKHRLPLPLEARRRTTGSQTSSSRRIDDLATNDVETPDRLRPERNPRTIPIAGWLYRAVRAAGLEATLRYEHRRAATERLLGIPEAFAWCWAKGGHWRSHIRPVITVQTV